MPARRARRRWKSRLEPPPASSHRCERGTLRAMLQAVAIGKHARRDAIVSIPHLRAVVWVRRRPVTAPVRPVIARGMPEGAALPRPAGPAAVNHACTASTGVRHAARRLEDSGSATGGADALPLASVGEHDPCGTRSIRRTDCIRDERGNQLNDIFMYNFRPDSPLLRLPDNSREGVMGTWQFESKIRLSLPVVFRRLEYHATPQWLGARDIH